jgi:hypothetical protein
MHRHTSWTLANTGLLLGVSMSLTLSTILCFGEISFPFVVAAMFLGALCSLFVIRFWKSNRPKWFVLGILFGILSFSLLPTAFSISSSYAIYSMLALFVMLSTFFLIVSLFKNRIVRSIKTW